MPALWSIVLTDRTFTPVGQVRNFSGFNFLSALSKLATGGFTVRLDHPLVDPLANCDGYVKLYRAGVLQAVGPLVTAEEVAQSNQLSLAVTFTDIGWILSKRVSGRILANPAAGDATWATPTDRAVIASALIDQANMDQDTHVSTSTYTPSAGQASTFKATFRNTLECIQELGDVLDGFDWRIVPIENWVNGALAGSKVGAFQAAPLIGTNQTNAVFEYGAGTRSNVLGYSKIRSRDGQATTVFIPGADPTNTVGASNTAAETTWGLLQDVVSADITDTPMRLALAREHVKIRGNPRDLIRMTPHIDPGVTGRLPLPFADYNVGDTITFNAAVANRVRFAGLVRVYGIRVTLEDTGFERVELILEKEN